MTDEQRKRQYESIKRWLNTPAGRLKRYQLRKGYYDRTKHLTKGKRRWTQHEIDLMFMHKGTDEELAYTLHRSVAAIQAKRGRIVREGN